VIKENKLRQTAKITSITEFEPWEPNQKAGAVTRISSTGIKMYLIDT
jgi:hypothetical protein